MSHFSGVTPLRIECDDIDITTINIMDFKITVKTVAKSIKLQNELLRMSSKSYHNLYLLGWQLRSCLFFPLCFCLLSHTFFVYYLIRGAHEYARALYGNFKV